MAQDPRWRRVQELAEAAEAQPATERASWLEAAEPDPGVRSEALDLLTALAAESAANQRAEWSTDAPLPAAIGSYRILELAGSGGRGTVYRAIRAVAGGSQEVAVKLLRDLLTTPEEQERFRREQRILAGLSHPSIARFLDAGVEPSGQAYLVIEWIDGEPLDRYAAGLPRAERVRLMADVLDALQAAHQSLVVHLDVKPSNILVDRGGRVRLIDFGTAKLLDSAGVATQTLQLTPSFASPEQLRGEPATAAADQYGAALTLRALLTGESTGTSSLAALAERAQSDCEIRIPGEPDLEAILQKALRFDSTARYRSAAEFADDLRAWLDRRPVRARPATRLYRLRRFVARHRAAVAVSTLLSILLIALATYAFSQKQERLRQAERAAAIASFLSGMINSSSTASAGRGQISVLEMVERAHDRIEQGAPLPQEVASHLQSSFAYFLREAGRDEQAEKVARAALRRAEASGDPEARFTSRSTLAEIAIRLGRCEEAVALYREADRLRDKASVGPGVETAYLEARAAAKSRCEGDPAAAVSLLEQALRRADAIEPRDSAVVPGVYRASLYNALALELARLQRFDAARAAVAAGLRQAEAHPDGRYFRVSLRRILGQVESRAGRHGEALAAFEQALALAPGVTNAFEELRLELMAAGQQADLGQKETAVARVLAAVARIDAGKIGATRWMLLADAGEVMARANACPAALALYAQVDGLTQGQIPRDWRANRLFYSAQCTADPKRAAEMAREALAQYGAQLPKDSRRRRSLDAMIAAGEQKP